MEHVADSNNSAEPKIFASYLHIPAGNAQNGIARRQRAGVRKRMGSGDPPGLQNRRVASSRCHGCVRLAHASAKSFSSLTQQMVYRFAGAVATSPEGPASDGLNLAEILARV